MLTARQTDLLKFLESHVGDVAPTFEEMAKAVDLKSKSGIHRLLDALEERGYIRRLRNRARAVEVLRASKARDGWPQVPPTGSSATPYEALIRKVRQLAVANGVALHA